MAKIVPNSPKYYNNRSDAEVKIYESLRDKLSDEWFIIHSYRWLKSTPIPKGKPQGEGDFIIAHPSYGILVIEVKGGNIRFKDNMWFSIGARNKVYELQNPVKQASDTKFELRNRLTSKGYNWFLGHAVWFPDILFDTSELPAEVDKAIVFDSTTLANPLPAIQSAFNFWYARINFKRISHTPEQFQELKDFLIPCFDLIKTLKQRCDELNDVYIKLTEEQKSLLDNLENFNELTVTGRAGTGKTVIAIEKARRDAQAGKNVLYLCFNTELSKKIKEDSKGLFTVKTIHSYALDYMKSFHPSRVLRFEDDPNFEYLMLEFTEVADSKEQYDSLIIDEAQDFYKNWVDAVRKILKPEGTFYIFYDPYQHLYTAQNKFDDSYLRITKPFILTKNMRNTDEISKACLNIIGEKHVKEYFRGIHGDCPDIVLCSDTNEVNAKLKEIVNGLTVDKAIPREYMTVITLENEKKTCITDPITENLSEQFTTVRKFKGLENDFVIIVDANLSHVLDPVRQRDLYTSISRAKFHSIVILHVDSRYKMIAMQKWHCNEEELGDRIKNHILGGIPDGN